ncbi:MAG: (d)CMP kinase [Ilumatobacteraceae bacterium]|nr:(d)CMP kinase [Ilumatobacteraceae bacterium]
MAVIAIDGPAGAGKSTVAKLVAEATGLPYLDTGAMYRCVALLSTRTGIDSSNEIGVAAIAESIDITFRGVQCWMNGEDVSQEIRSAEIASIVSIIAAQSPVRTAMRTQQQRWIQQQGGGVVEGRDIGTVVFPNAELKVFLTASPEERASRRVGQSGGDLKEIAFNIAERDRIDSERIDSPLRPAGDAVVIDSTGLTITEVVDVIVDHFTHSLEKRHG